MIHLIKFRAFALINFRSLANFSQFFNGRSMKNLSYHDEVSVAILKDENALLIGQRLKFVSSNSCH